MMHWLAWLSLVATVAVVRLLFVLPSCCRPRRRRTTSPASVLVVFGSGGHTAEMLSLLKALPEDRYNPRYYVVANTDVTSEPRAKATTVGYTLQVTPLVLSLCRCRWYRHPRILPASRAVAR
jgi:hypothetical protein